MTFQPEFIAAFVMGFLGSLHCVGMCGPIALVTPSLFPGTSGRILSGLLYSSGRILTYMGLGIIAGLLGKGVVFFKWQQGFSIAIGIIIILSVLAPKIFSSGKAFRLGFSFTNKVKSAMGQFLKKKSAFGILSIGLVNGLLPCGLVYLGLAGSMDMSTATNGALFMFVFGLGTLPMMTGIHLAGNNLKGTFKNKLSRILPIFIIAMGMLFIVRGLGLGIPYVSPSINPHTGDIHCVSPAHRHY